MVREPIPFESLGKGKAIRIAASLGYDPKSVRASCTYWGKKLARRYTCTLEADKSLYIRCLEGPTLAIVPAAPVPVLQTELPPSWRAAPVEEDDGPSWSKEAAKAQPALPVQIAACAKCGSYHANDWPCLFA